MYCKILRIKEPLFLLRSPTLIRAILFKQTIYIYIYYQCVCKLFIYRHDAESSFAMKTTYQDKRATKHTPFLAPFAYLSDEEYYLATAICLMTSF